MGGYYTAGDLGWSTAALVQPVVGPGNPLVWWSPQGGTYPTMDATKAGKGWVVDINLERLGIDKICSSSSKVFLSERLSLLKKKSEYRSSSSTRN